MRSGALSCSCADFIVSMETMSWIDARAQAKHRRMELFILPMSCSFAAHVACLEAGLTPTLRCVHRDSKLLDDGTAYASFAPKTHVPAIRTDDGWVLTESSAVLQYIADLAPDRKLAPPAGTRERYRLAEWLNFVSTEVHKKHLWPIFSTKVSAEHK